MFDERLRTVGGGRRDRVAERWAEGVESSGGRTKAPSVAPQPAGNGEESMEVQSSQQEVPANWINEECMAG